MKKSRILRYNDRPLKSFDTECLTFVILVFGRNQSFFFWKKNWDFSRSQNRYFFGLKIDIVLGFGRRFCFWINRNLSPQNCPNGTAGISRRLRLTKIILFFRKKTLRLFVVEKNGSLGSIPVLKKEIGTTDCDRR